MLCFSGVLFKMPQKVCISGIFMKRRKILIHSTSATSFFGAPNFLYFPPIQISSIFFTNIPTFFPPISPQFFFPKIFSPISQLLKSTSTLLSTVSKGNSLPLLFAAAAGNSVPRGILVCSLVWFGISNLGINIMFKKYKVNFCLS